MSKCTATEHCNFTAKLKVDGNDTCSLHLTVRVRNLVKVKKELGSPTLSVLVEVIEHAEY